MPPKRTKAPEMSSAHDAPDNGARKSSRAKSSKFKATPLPPAETGTDYFQLEPPADPRAKSDQQFLAAGIIINRGNGAPKKPTADIPSAVISHSPRNAVVQARELASPRPDGDVFGRAIIHDDTKPFKQTPFATNGWTFRIEGVCDPVKIYDDAGISKIATRVLISFENKSGDIISKYFDFKDDEASARVDFLNAVRAECIAGYSTRLFVLKVNSYRFNCICEHDGPHQPADIIDRDDRPDISDDELAACPELNVDGPAVKITSDRATSYWFGHVEYSGEIHPAIIVANVFKGNPSFQILARAHIRVPRIFVNLHSDKPSHKLEFEISKFDDRSKSVVTSRHEMIASEAYSKNNSPIQTIFAQTEPRFGDRDIGHWRNVFSALEAKASRVDYQKYIGYHRKPSGELVHVAHNSVLTSDGIISHSDAELFPPINSSANISNPEFQTDDLQSHIDAVENLVIRLNPESSEIISGMLGYYFYSMLPIFDGQSPHRVPCILALTGRTNIGKSPLNFMFQHFMGSGFLSHARAEGVSIRIGTALSSQRGELLVKAKNAFRVEPMRDLKNDLSANKKALANFALAIESQYDNDGGTISTRDQQEKTRDDIIGGYVVTAEEPISDIFRDNGHASKASRLLEFNICSKPHENIVDVLNKKLTRQNLVAFGHYFRFWCILKNSERDDFYSEFLAAASEICKNLGMTRDQMLDAGDLGVDDKYVRTIEVPIAGLFAIRTFVLEFYATIDNALIDWIDAAIPQLINYQRLRHERLRIENARNKAVDLSTAIISAIRSLSDNGYFHVAKNAYSELKSIGINLSHLGYVNKGYGSRENYVPVNPNKQFGKISFSNGEIILALLPSNIAAGKPLFDEINSYLKRSISRDLDPKNMRDELSKLIRHKNATSRGLEKIKIEGEANRVYAIPLETIFPPEEYLHDDDDDVTPENPSGPEDDDDGIPSSAFDDAFSDTLN